MRRADGTSPSSAPGAIVFFASFRSAEPEPAHQRRVNGARRGPPILDQGYVNRHLRTARDELARPVERIDQDEALPDLRYAPGCHELLGYDRHARQRIRQQRNDCSLGSLSALVTGDASGFQTASTLRLKIPATDLPAMTAIRASRRARSSRDIDRS